MWSESYRIGLSLQLPRTHLASTAKRLRLTAQGCAATLGIETPNPNYAEGVAPIPRDEDKRQRELRWGKGRGRSLPDYGGTPLAFNLHL